MTARWRLPGNALPMREQAALWRAAARGAHVNGDHEAEVRFRNQARLIEGVPPLREPVRCLRRVR